MGELPVAWHKSSSLSSNKLISLDKDIVNIWNYWVLFEKGLPSNGVVPHLGECLSWQLELGWGLSY